MTFEEARAQLRAALQKEWRVSRVTGAGTREAVLARTTILGSGQYSSKEWIERS